MSVKMREGLEYITFVTATSLLTQSLLLTLFSTGYEMLQNANFFFFAIRLVRITQAWVNILNSFSFFW